MNKIIISTVPILLLFVSGVIKNQDRLAVMMGQPTMKRIPKRFPSRHATLTPQDMEILARKGALDKAARDFLDRGRYAEAEAAARQSYAMGSGMGRNVLASALYAQGKDEEALPIYAVITQSGTIPTSGEWPYALLLLKVGRWAEAVQAYNTAVTMGGDTGLLRRYTQFSADMPQPQELKAALLIGWATMPGGGSFHGSYEDKKKQAQAMYDEALSLAPHSAVAHYYYAYGLNRMGRRAEAKAAFQKAADMDTSGDVKAAAEAQLSRL